MITPHCDHPPLVLLTSGSLDSHTQDRIEAQLAEAKPGKPWVLMEDMRIEVIECSWCRRPAHTRGRPHRPDARDQYPPGTLFRDLAALRIVLTTAIVAIFTPMLRKMSVFWGRLTSTAPQPFSHGVSEQDFRHNRAQARARVSRGE